MEEMRVYIANLGKYNEGESVGAWFTLPVDEDEVAERIGLGGRYEEYAIHDYELPFKIEEYMSIDSLNYLHELAEDLPEEIQEEISALMGHFSTFEELCDKADDIILHSGCNSVEDVAYEYIEECGVLDGLPQNLQCYFDYAALARDMAIEGRYVETNRGVFEICY